MQCCCADTGSCQIHKEIADNAFGVSAMTLAETFNRVRHHTFPDVLSAARFGVLNGEFDKIHIWIELLRNAIE